MTEISKRQKLLVLLKDKELTAKEISEQLEIPIEYVRTYISQFPQIKKVGKKGRYNLYRFVEAKPIEIDDSGVMSNFKRLYEIMNIWLISKMTQKQISNIPENVLKELDNMEGILNVKSNR